MRVRRLIPWVCLVAICLLVAVGSAVAAPATAPPAPSPTVEPTATSAPTATLTATATPRPPTATPTTIPTATATVNVRSTGQRSEDLGVDFGDFTSTVRIWYPAGTGPFSTVLVLSGSGADHVDEPYYQTLTGALLARGYAVARYTKHYVYTPANGAQRGTFLTGVESYLYQVSPRQLLIDADQVYRAIAARPRVDRARIVIYGQSQGGIIAAQLALAHPDAGGVILQGTPARPEAEEIVTHYRQLVRPFLQEVVDTNHDGFLTARELLVAQAKWYDTAMELTFAYLVNSGGASQINDYLDLNHDGRLEIAREIDPAYEDPSEQSSIDLDPHRTLPPASQVADYRGPILVQQGGRDGYVAPDNAEIFRGAFDAARHPDQTILYYSELGHALGTASSRYADPVGDIAPKPLTELLDWLDGHVRRR